MRRQLWVALRTATVVAATVGTLGVAGCSNHGAKNSASDAPSAPAAASSEAATPPGKALPAPEVLVDVLVRLSDQVVPGINKIGLGEGAPPDSAAVLDKYSNALRDNGYLPMTFTADHIAWSDQTPADATA